MPSMPLAWKAMVGAPGPASSSAFMWSPRRSAMDDSASPHVRTTRLRMTSVTPLRDRRSGRMARSSISTISWGTPGTA